MFEREERLDHHVCKMLKQKGLKVLKQGRSSNPGYPDLLILLGGGRHCWVELKAAKGVPTAQQRLRFSKLTEAGDKVAVCRTVREVDEFILGLTNGENFTTYLRID